jgi:hypothetical protein
MSASRIGPPAASDRQKFQSLPLTWSGSGVAASPSFVDADCMIR